MVNAAIVGLGRWGQRLVDSVSNPASAAIRFTHAVTRTPDKVRDYCAARGLVLADTLDTVLTSPRIEAVVLATPHSQHAGQIIQAAQAGKHIFVEKPFTLDVTSAVSAARACKSAGVVLAIGHNRRFLPAMTEMRRLVSAGELGEILHIEGAFSGNFGLGYTPGIWRASQTESPVGGMTAMGIHIIDAFIHLAGRVASVRCESYRNVLKVDLDDTTSALMRFESGATGYLSTLTATGRIVRVQLFGTRGWVHLLDHHLLDRCNLDGQVTRTEYPKVDLERLELEAFAAAANRTAPYPIPIEQVVHGVAVMQSSFLSAARDGERVPVSAGELDQNVL